MSILSVPVTATNMPEWVRRVANAVNQIIAKRASIVTAIAAYSLDEGVDLVLANAASGAFSVTLPEAAKFTGKQFIIKKIDATANAVTIDGNGAETIDGAATVALTTQYESRTIISNGTGWSVI